MLCTITGFAGVSLQPNSGAQGEFAGLMVIRAYFKHRKNATGEPPMRFEQLPPVTIQLPLYNERYVVERLIEHERQQRPKATRLTCLQNAIQRWDRENQR